MGPGQNNKQNSSYLEIKLTNKIKKDGYRGVHYNFLSMWHIATDELGAEEGWPPAGSVVPP